jgi:uncharacterized protein
MSSTHWWGIISDTHGLLRPEALEALQGCERIIHAGDIGSQEILAKLGAVAPVVAVRGNVDTGPWALALPESGAVQAGTAYIYVLHDLQRLDLDPAGGGFAAVISGHSHRPGIDQRGGVLYLNPGSAGPHRFHLPVTLARLHLDGGKLEPEIVALDAGPHWKR